MKSSPTICTAALLLTIVVLEIGILGCSEAADVSSPRPSTRQTTPSKNSTQDWPRWLGSDFTGISSDNDWQSDWGDEGPTVAWEAQLGTGYSSVSVVGDRLFSMGHADGEDTVFCLDVGTGEQVWTHSYECKLVDNLHFGGPAATPTVDGPNLYTLSKEGHFYCLDIRTGEPLWQRHLQEDLDVKMPGWGFSSSPLIYNNLVIVDGGCTAAYDKLSGELIWKTEAYRPGYGSAVSFSYEGEDLVAVLNNEALIVVTAAGGELRAKTKWLTPFDTSAYTPQVHGDQIFVSTGYKVGCGLFRFTGDALEKIYRNREMACHMNNCVIYDGHIYGFHGNSHSRRTATLRCMNYDTGELVWEARKTGYGVGSITMAGDTLIALSDEGRLITLKPSTDELQVIAEAEILESSKCWTVPVLAQGRIFARSPQGKLACVDVRK